MQSTVYFSLGSNLGDRYSNLSECVSLIENNVGEIKSLSSIYKNSAQGFIGDYFYNCCIKVSTSYKPHELIDIILSIEKTMGRKIWNTQKYESRKIDIDIILYDDLIIEQKNFYELNFEPSEKCKKYSTTLSLVVNHSPNLVAWQDDMVIEKSKHPTLKDKDILNVSTSGGSIAIGYKLD